MGRQGVGGGEGRAWGQGTGQAGTVGERRCGEHLCVASITTLTQDMPSTPQTPPDPFGADCLHP